MIEVKNLVKQFRPEEPPVIKNLNFSIHDGDFLSIWGRSGSGKTTLLYLLSSLDRPTSGEVWMDGKDLARLNSREIHDLRNQKIGFIFQFHYLLPEITALENVLMPARRNGQQGHYLDKAKELLQRVGLDGKFHRLPGQLSGGEQQRVAIARSLILSPKYLFADEPTGSLDSVNGDRVMQLLMEANAQWGTTLILVTHEQEYASLARRSIYLKDGQMVHKDQF